MAGELFEAGDVDTLGDPARNRPAPQAVTGKGRRVEPDDRRPVLDDQRDRIGGSLGMKPISRAITAVGRVLVQCPRTQ
jgi:hypothetical protein